MATSLTTPPAMRGKKLLPFEYNLNDESDICFTLPWAEILERAIADGADFNEAYARDNPPKYQVSVWYDTSFSDEDDFNDLAGTPINLSDFLPNTDAGCQVEGEYNPYPPCEMNQEGLYGDIDVDADDVTMFLEQFGREEYYNRCPGCRE